MPATRSQPKGKRWLITLWNTERNNDPIGKVVAALPVAAELAYAVGQTELGKVAEADNDEEKVHQHVYLRFNKQYRMTQIKRWLGDDTAHCEIARGSEEECHNYCTKDDTRTEGWHGEHGVYKPELRQGARTDIEDVAKKVIEGTPMRELAIESPAVYVKYHTGLNALRNLCLIPEQIRTVKCYYFWGPTGTGKSYRIFSNYPIQTICPVTSGSTHPWDFYQGQETVVIDEFLDSHWQIQTLNRILDGYPLAVPARFYDRWAKWTTVFILSNLEPAQLYQWDKPEMRETVLRRISAGVRYIELREDQGGPTLKQLME